MTYDEWLALPKDTQPPLTRAGQISHAIDLTGRKFYKLTVIGRYPGTNNKGEALWYCKCDCGNPELVVVSGRTLRHSDKKSCGCLQKGRPSASTLAKYYSSDDVIEKKKLTPNNRYEDLPHVKKRDFKLYKETHPWERFTFFDSNHKSVQVEFYEAHHDAPPGIVRKLYKRGYTTSEIAFIVENHDRFAHKDAEGTMRDEDGFICLIPRRKDTTH